jgi:integrase
VAENQAQKLAFRILIVTETGTQMDRAGCTRQYQRYLEFGRKIGMELPKITMHSLRHVALSAMAQINPEHARAVAGHAHIQTTIRNYTHTTNDAVRATHALADPLAGVLLGMRQAQKPRARKLA